MINIPTFKQKSASWAVIVRCCLCFAIGCGFAAALTSCSGDDYQPDLAAPVIVLKSDLLFEPQGRTGSVEVQAVGEVTATVGSDWCTASVSGHVVSVTVSDNTSFEGRTALLTIRADGGQVQLPVQQRGIALGSLNISAYRVGDSGGHASFYIRHDLPVNLSCDEPWVHARMDGDSLMLDFEPNADHRIRRAVLEYECAGYTGQLDVSQYDLDRVLGEWLLVGTINGTEQGFRFNLMRQNGEFFIQFTGLIDEWKTKLHPVDFDEEHCVLTLHSGLVMAEKNTGTDYLFFFNSSGAVVQTSDATLKATIYFNPLWGTHYAALEDGGTWGDGTLMGLSFYTYNSLAGWIPLGIQMSYPYILRTGASL